MKREFLPHMSYFLIPTTSLRPSVMLTRHIVMFVVPMPICDSFESLVMDFHVSRRKGLLYQGSSTSSKKIVFPQHRFHGYKDKVARRHAHKIMLKKRIAGLVAV